MNKRREKSTPPNVDGPPYTFLRSRSSFSDRSTSSPSSLSGSATAVFAPSQFNSTQPSGATQQQIDRNNSSSGRLGKYFPSSSNHQQQLDYTGGYLPSAAFIGPSTTTASVLPFGGQEFVVSNSSSFTPNNHPFYGEDSSYSGLSVNISGVPVYYPSSSVPTQQVLRQSKNPSPVYNMKNNNNNKSRGDSQHNNTLRPSTTSGFHPYPTSSSTAAVQHPQQQQQQPQQPQQQRTEDWIDLEDVMDGPSAAIYQMNITAQQQQRQQHPQFITTNNNNNNPPLFIGGGVSGSYPLGVFQASTNTPPPPGPGPSSTAYGRSEQQRQYVRTPPYENVEHQQQQQPSMGDVNMMTRMQQQQQQQRDCSITPPPPPHYHSSPGANYYYSEQQYPMDDHYYQQLAAHAGYMQQQQQQPVMMMTFPQQQQQQQYPHQQQQQQQPQQDHHTAAVRHRRRSGDGIAATTVSNSGSLPFSPSSSNANIGRQSYSNNNDEMMRPSPRRGEEEDEENEHEEDDEDGPIEDLRYGLQKEHLSDLKQGNLHQHTHDEEAQQQQEQQRRREEEEDKLLMMMKRQRPASSIGENRLKIKFESLGTLGEIKQTYGRRDSIIPDGICGSNEVYNERWSFEIKHHRCGQRVLIEWLITNLATNKLYTRRETVEESIIRETQGKTICNQVLKQALDDRADELEKELRLAEEEKNTTRVSNLTSRVRALRPKRCLIGLLFFGLQHQSVQDHMKMLEDQQQKQQHQASSVGADHNDDNGHQFPTQQQHQDPVDKDNGSKGQVGESHGHHHHHRHHHQRHHASNGHQ